MAKNNVTDYSNTASLNTDVQSVDIAENCAPSGINNALREIMADIADVNDGTVTLTSPAVGSMDAGSIDVTGNIVVGGTVDGRDIATDGTKLDGVEALADVTDTASVTAAGALMDSELTDLAAVKAINQGLTTTSDVVFNTLNTFDPADFLRVAASSLANDGYVKLSNGLIIQWGRDTLTASGGQSITWPIAFVSTPFISFGVEVSDANANANITGGTRSATGWTGIDTASAGTYHWIAIGV